MRKNKKNFEALKQQLILRSIESKKIKRIPLFDYVPKMIYGCSILSMDMVEKCKLLSNVDYHIIRKERFLYNINKK